MTIRQKQQDSAPAKQEAKILKEQVEEEEEDIVDKNVHFYTIAILMSIAKLIFTWSNQEDVNMFKINEANIIFAIEIVSIPLSVINPSAWFAIFMTSLSTLCVTTGYPTFAILSAVLMFFTIYSSEFVKNRETSEKSYQALEAKPMVDEKVWAEMMI